MSVSSSINNECKLANTNNNPDPAAAVDSINTSNTDNYIQPVVFVTHGGGPCFYVDGREFPAFADIDKNSAGAQFFRDLPKQLNLDLHRPKAILVVSAHWETSKTVRITNQKQHTKLYYDYGGFPAHTYKLQFNPPGNPSLAAHIAELLTAANIPAQLDSTRDFDHGVFVPLLLSFPAADIPVISMSILNSLNPAEHIHIGSALEQLRAENILIICSGAITHGHANTAENMKFVNTLLPILTSSTVNERQSVLIDWQKRLPAARKVHPREEHFIPLHVAVGAAGQSKGIVLNEIIGKLGDSIMPLHAVRFG